jgi:hypothetical protein
MRQETMQLVQSSGAIDEVLMVCYVICVKEYLKLGLPPFVVFQDPSLEDMALKNILFLN